MNLFPVILDLCGGSGAWSKPYRESGKYEVLVIDPKVDGQDVRVFGAMKGVHGILCAPPCTVFARSGARWPRTQQEMLEGLSVVDACLRIVYACRPKWWCLENPPGKLSRWLGPIKCSFQPYMYGDPYRKMTCLWGDFTMPEKTPVEPPARNGRYKYQNSWFDKVGGRSEKTKAYRSQTPAGFAQAFFKANP